MQPAGSPRASGPCPAAEDVAAGAMGNDDAAADGRAFERLAENGVGRARGRTQEGPVALLAAERDGSVSAANSERATHVAGIDCAQAWRLERRACRAARRVERSRRARRGSARSDSPGLRQTLRKAMGRADLSAHGSSSSAIRGL